MANIEFDAKKMKDECVNWIKEWFENNGPGCNAVIGISGGKDSTVVAALCCEALGKDRVIGVLMPQGIQDDIDVARNVCEYLGIKSYEINIIDSVKSVLNRLETAGIEISDQTKINLPPRIRMSTLYAVSQSMNGRVANTCNFSETWIGYETRWGDQVGDFAPIAELTVSEVKAIGHELGLPKKFIEKIPSDGLCGKTDEENFGFTYEVLDKYLDTNVCDDPEIAKRIDDMYEKSLFKSQSINIPTFTYMGYNEHFPMDV